MLTSHILAVNHTAHTADWEELYKATVPGGVVFSRAFTPVQIPNNATADPMQIPVMLRMSVCKNFARGMIGSPRTATIATRYPNVVKVAAT